MKEHLMHQEIRVNELKARTIESSLSNYIVHWKAFLQFYFASWVFHSIIPIYVICAELQVVLNL